MNAVIAVLAETCDKALWHLGTMKCVDEFDRKTRKGVFLSGIEFVVVTDPEQLKGLRLRDYILAGSVSDEMLALARERMPR